MLEVKQLYKSFEDKEVLKGIDTVFMPGKTNLVIGQSGSGKTVLLNCIVGLYEPTSGDLLYDNQSLLLMNKKEKTSLRRQMGMLFQSAALFDSMTVLGNVLFPLQMFSSLTPREMQRRACFCLERVNLSDAEYKYPGELSGGMQKRAAIARAIALEPRYLFCDEPNSGLDPKTSLVIDHLIQDITHEYGITTIINTHDMNSVLGIGENILFLSNGRKAWEGTKEQIRTDNADLPESLSSFIFASDILRNMIIQKL